MKFISCLCIKHAVMITEVGVVLDSTAFAQALMACIVVGWIGTGCWYQLDAEGLPGHVAMIMKLKRCKLSTQ
jgi:hypothetical protein